MIPAADWVAILIDRIHCGRHDFSDAKALLLLTRRKFLLTQEEDLFGVELARIFSVHLVSHRSFSQTPVQHHEKRVVEDASLVAQHHDTLEGNKSNGATGRAKGVISDIVVPYL